jgi:1-aminocyclopropane-1-carboxylate deaminase
VLAAGTGTTLAGVAAGLGPGWKVIGVSALRGASDLDLRVEAALQGIGAARPAAWRILHHAHCGGFARVSDALREFILAFERVHGVPLDPVYTAKALYAIFSLLRSGEWQADQPVVMIHTGGLQGRRGFPFLDSSRELAL